MTSSRFDVSSTTISRGSVRTPFCSGSGFKLWSNELYGGGHGKLGEVMEKTRWKKESNAVVLKRVYARRAK